MTSTQVGSLVAAAAMFLGACSLESNQDELPAEHTAEVAQALTGTLAFRGVNLCGAEWGMDAYGNGATGTHGSTYTYPDPDFVSGYNSADYFVGKGVNTFRLPFRWERLQPTRGQALNVAELGRLKTTVNRLVGKGATVILDPQNFARYGTSLIGSPAVPNSHFADFWSRLATEFKASPNVLFNLVNEPHDIGTEQWVSAANAAIAAIRATGAANLILVPGNGWTGAHSWTSSYYGTPNSTALLNIVDSKNNYAFEVHQYLDPDSSGGGSTCVSGTIGSERMKAFTGWLRANGKRGFLGEFGGPSSTTCASAIDDILKHVEANADVYLGWAYWAAGPLWKGYPLSVEPVSGTDTLQMKALLPHFKWAPAASAPATAPASAPATTTCQPSTYEAETMVKTTGGATTGGWNVWSNGSISTTAAFGSGKTTVTVYAAGQAAGGVSPRMTVSVGGLTIGSASVSSSAYAAYVFSVDATAGSKEIRVTYDNDGTVLGADRNLLVDKVVVGCPAASACVARSFEAETMTKSTGGAVAGGWNVWSNGSVSTSATFGVGPTTIAVTAAGTVAGGVWPHFVVSVNGKAIGSGYASSTTWREYPFTFAATAGTQTVSVTFDNDGVVSGADRNLLLDKVVVRCP